MRTADRRTRWRQAVFEPRAGMTDACRVLLLYLHDYMNHKGIVSRPRSKITADLGIHSARVTERLKLAKDLGFISPVRRGRPHVTAVYQAVIPSSEAPVRRVSRGTSAVPLEVRQPGSDEVRQPYLPDGPRGTAHRQPSSSTQVEHSSVRRAVSESATRSAATRSTDDEPEAEVTAPRRAWEDSA